MKNKIIALCWFVGLGVLSAAVAFFEQQRNSTAYYVLCSVIGYYLATGGILLRIFCKKQTLLLKIVLGLFIALTFLGSTFMLIALLTVTKWKIKPWNTTNAKNSFTASLCGSPRGRVRCSDWRGWIWLLRWFHFLYFAYFKLSAGATLGEDLYRQA